MAKEKVIIDEPADDKKVDAGSNLLDRTEGDMDPLAHAAALAGLSPEEQAALQDDEDNAGSGDADDTGGDAGDPAPLLADPAEPADPAADAAAPGTTTPDKGLSPDTTVFASDVDIEALGAKIVEVDAQIVELDKKYDDGEIEFAEYRAQDRALNDQRTGLLGDRREAELATKVNEQSATRSWKQNVGDWLASNDQFAKPTMQAALNTALQTLYADEANANASPQWLLDTAAAQVRLDMGITAPADEVDPNAAAIAAAKKRTAKAADARDALPKTLADAPAAGDDVPTDNEFAALDKLNGMQLEAAVARLTPEQQERFANG